MRGELPAGRAQHSPRDWSLPRWGLRAQVLQQLLGGLSPVLRLLKQHRLDPDLQDGTVPVPPRPGAAKGPSGGANPEAGPSQAAGATPEAQTSPSTKTQGKRPRSAALLALDKSSLETLSWDPRCCQTKPAMGMLLGELPRC